MMLGTEEEVVMRTVLLPKEMDESLSEVAFRANVKMGDIIRQSLKNELKRLEAVGAQLKSADFKDGKLATQVR